MARILSLILVLFAMTISTIAFAHDWDDSTVPEHLRGDGVVTIFRPITDEKKTFEYRDAMGNYDDEVLVEIAYFFRCRMTSEIQAIDPGLIEVIDAVEDQFAGHEVRLISAYRSEMRNTSMRRRGRRVAKRSLHMVGRAADIEIRGIPSHKVRNFAYSLKQGGVGYYRGRHFVHVDTGPLRTWGWKPRTTRSAPAVAHK